MSLTPIDEDYRRSLRTIDQEGRRKWVYAEVLQGAWRSRRKYVALGLMAVFFLFPWIHIHGLPLAQVDVFNRRLTLFGQVFWAHELNLFITAILGTIFGIYALTAWGGRVFCGWFCPHATWMEMVFRPMEHLIEGRSNQRRKLDNSPFSKNKALKKIAKWTLYSLVA